MKENRANADLLFQAIMANQILAYVTATTITDIFYITHKNSKSLDLARQAISDILTLMKICPVNRAILKSALLSKLPDFEDAVQIVCAISEDLDVIVTRDVKGFRSSQVAVMSVVEVLSRIEQINNDKPVN